jgi:hypothetical protein
MQQVAPIRPPRLGSALVVSLAFGLTEGCDTKPQHQPPFEPWQEVHGFFQMLHERLEAAPGQFFVALLAAYEAAPPSSELRARLKSIASSYRLSAMHCDPVDIDKEYPLECIPLADGALCYGFDVRDMRNFDRCVPAISGH